MNVKPGDLALVVKQMDNQNKLVQVLCPSPMKGIHDVDWIIEPLSRSFKIVHIWPDGSRGKNTIERTNEEVHMADRFLRPIRDNDDEDETLTWAGKPKQLEKT